MGDWTPFILSVIGMAALVGYIMFRYTSDVTNKASMAKSLGLTPLERAPQLIENKIFSLHRPVWLFTQYRLVNVSHRALKDGELFLFDLVHRPTDSGDQWVQTQAVAIRSAALRLPHFQLHPKMTLKKFVLDLLKNRFANWDQPKTGKKVEFPQSPAFHERYSVTSESPDILKQFFDARLVQYFAKTEYYSLRAEDDLFVFVDLEPGFNVQNAAHMTRRLKRAMEIYRLLCQN